CATATGSTYSWSGPGIVGSNTGSCIDVNAPGTYTVMATKTSSGCQQSCSIVVTQDNSTPGLQCGSGINLTCFNNNSGQICATATGSTYSWSGPGIVGS